MIRGFETSCNHRNLLTKTLFDLNYFKVYYRVRMFQCVYLSTLCKLSPLYAGYQKEILYIKKACRNQNMCYLPVCVKKRSIETFVSKPKYGSKCTSISSKIIMNFMLYSAFDIREKLQCRNELDSNKSKSE
jgi:hypothetical protein